MISTKKPNIPSLISKRGREESKEKEEDKKKKVKGKTGKKNTFSPHLQKRRETLRSQQIM